MPLLQHQGRCFFLTLFTRNELGLKFLNEAFGFL